MILTVLIGTGQRISVRSKKLYMNPRGADYTPMIEPPVFVFSTESSN